MLHEVRMPELGSDVTEADLVQWLVAPGDTVAQGDLIAEFETDKSTVEYEAPTSGVVVELCLSAPTSGVQVGDLIARIEVDDVGAVDDATAAPSPPPPPAQGKLEHPPDPPVESTAQVRTAPVEAEPTQAASPTLDAPQTTAVGEVAATALARRIAERDGVDLGAVEPTGAGGRVTKADVIAAAGAARDDAAVPLDPQPLSRMRRTIAARMSAAKREIPHFYLEVDCNAGTLLEVHRTLNEGLEDANISLNDLCVAAAARALRDVPEANVAFRGDHIEPFDTCDIAVAVATKDGLITPVLRDAAGLGLLEISKRLRDLVTRARAGQLAPSEYQGGFALSNLGMFGVTAVWPIINPPHACIVGIGAVESTPVIEAGQVVPGSVMRCTLSADHRAVDGAIGARWLARFRHYVEDPREMLL